MSSQVKGTPVEIHWFRKALAVVTVFYYVSLFTRVQDFFGAHGWMKNSLRDDFFSVLFLSDSDYWRWFLIGVMFVLMALFYKGLLNRIGLLFFYLINLSFYLWNPLIVHEPQPIMDLFFISFFFLPMKERDHNYDPWIKNTLIVFLGVYYFLAGVKKLPDPNFLNGSALGSIISWPIMAKNVKFNLFFIKYFSWVLLVFNYATLIFEMGFIFFVFTRYRIYLIFFGILLHVLIYMTLEVGNLSFVMILWYVLLLDENTRGRLKILYSKKM